MRFFIVDDSASIRAMLSNIIEDHDLGTVVGEAEDGSEVYSDVLDKEKIDILLIDLLMPNRDGIETVREISPHFQGKIIMISQVETKELIGEAYSLGVEHYITKPINQLEVVSVLRKVSGNLVLERSLKNIHESLSALGSITQKQSGREQTKRTAPSIVAVGKSILLELGIYGESGNKDLLDMLNVLYAHENEGNREMPALKDLFYKVMVKRLGAFASCEEIQKEVKAGEQRVRRVIHQALEHIASIGLTDFSNPKFENYASKFFDYEQVRMKMLELENKSEVSNSQSRINMKKFIQVLYIESLKAMEK